MQDLAPLITHSQVIISITSYGRHLESFHHALTRFTIEIDHVIHHALIVLLKDGHVDDILSNENLLRDFDHLTASCTGKHDHIIYIGTFLNKFILFETITH